MTDADMSTKALTIADTTLGKKYVMAITGVVLFGFVIAHMLGNLQVFLGYEAIDSYSKMLHDNPTLLWTARGVLLFSVVAHIVTAVQLASRNKAARPTPYRHAKRNIVTTYAARTMIWSGPILALYIVFHILHLTVGDSAGVSTALGYQHLQPLDPHGMNNVHANLVRSFQVPWCTAIYVVAQLALGLHIYHGAWSLFQSLGLNHKRYNETLRSVTSAIALAVVVGFLSVPIAIQTGLYPH